MAPQQTLLSILRINLGGSTGWDRIPDLPRPFPHPVIRFVHAPNFAAGIESLAATSMDAVLLTVGHGEPALDAVIRLHSIRPNCPIIVLGIIDDAEVARRLLEAGAADYLASGQFDGPLLHRAITYAVTRANDLKHMQETLGHERTLLRSLIDSIPDHIYVKDTDHRFRLANLATQRFFGVSDEYLIGKTDSELFPPDAASSFRSEDEQILRFAQSFVNREEKVVSADGRLRWNLTTKAPLRDGNQKVIGLVGINRDITDRKIAVEQLQRTNAILERREVELLHALDDLKCSHEALQTTQLQLLQVEKMESVGRLAAGIAHEVKNPLAIISTGIDFLNQSDAARDVPIGRALASMSRAVRRADSVIRGLLDFSAPAALQAEPVDLNSVIRQALILVDHELMRCKVSLKTELTEPLPMVSVDANKVEQVFLNLFINAIQAMPAGGDLTLRTRYERLATLGHNISDHRAERFHAGDVVVVAEVDDSGHGIPEEKLCKVFEPFFTTKPTGKGTGLGLSVAHTIIELHGGLLQLANRPEGGVRASLVLKATGDPPHDN